MGGVQSLTSSEGAIAATATLVVAGAVGYGVTTMSQQRSGRKDEGSSSRTGTGGRGKKKKKKQHDGVDLDSCRSANESGVATVTVAASATTEQAETATVVPFPMVIPGDFDVASAASISSKVKVKDKSKGKAKQTAGDDGASSATPSESQHPSVLASGSKSKKAKKKKKPSGPASSSNLASSLVASSSKVSTDGDQSRSAAPDKENHPLQSSVTAIGLESKAAKSQDNVRSVGLSSTEDEGAKKKSAPGTSTIGVRTMPGAVPAPVIVHPPHGYVSSHDTDSSWTHVRRDGGNSKSSHLNQSSTSGISTTEIMTSDAGIGSSVTDDGYPSSPVVERLEDTEDEEAEEEGPGLASGYSRDTTNTQRRPLAERLLPKPQKTGVEDMLETPDHPSLARVVRVRPTPGEKPVSGFSWADYEDVHVDEGAGHDADGEDDGWGVVRSRRSKPDRLPTSTEASTAAPKSQVEKVSSGTMSKKQRQNAKKREAAKTAKADAETQRVSTLAKHKQQLEKDRTMEQISTTAGKVPSGGMKASVDSNGKLVWD